ncbi:MAG TPA: phage major capsid protein, partial [Devosia sp.]|nr:phage major capsid protein [Devosia sp.]
IVESDPAFRAIVITPKSLAFYFKVSRELLADAPGLDEALNTVIAQAFAKAIDKAGLLGSGAGNEPRGLANTPGINVVSQGANGAALANYRAFVSAMTAIESLDAPSPTAAIMAPRTYGDIAGLTDSTGQPLRRPEALAGWKFAKSSQVPIDDTVGTSDDCSRLFVGDFTNFSFYMRESMTVMVLKELFAKTGEVGFAAHCRIDAAALYPQAFCMVNGTRPIAP